MFRLPLLRAPPTRWLLSLALVALATGLNFWLQDITQGRLQFLPYFPALIAIGYLCGPAPSVLAVVLSELAVAAFWLAPTGHALSALRSADAVLLVLFALAAAAAIGIAVLARRTVEERDRALEVAHAAQGRLDVALRGSAIFAWACDAERRCTWAYDPLAPLAPGALAGRPIADVMPRDLYAGHADAMDRVFASGRAERLPVTVDSGGEVRHCISHIDAVKDAEGRVTGLVGASVDVTDLHRAEDALAKTEELYLTLAEAAPDLMWRAAADGTALHVNRRWVEFTGLDLERLNAVGWAAATHPDDRARIAEIRQRAALRGEPFESEGRYRGRDGQYRWFWGRVVPVRDAQGHVQQWVGTFTDVTERKRIEAQLALESERKDEFFATLAHELRNPMAPIRYAAALLRPGARDEVVQRARAVIERQAARMARLLDDLLDMSRITRDAIELRPALLDLRDAVHEAVEAAQPALEAKEQRLVVSLPAQRVNVKGDAARLVQVVVNLLDNAGKYTERGGRVEVSVEARGAEAIVAVADTGIGLSPEAIPHVFDLFSQAHRSMEASKQGLGIGLFIVKRLAQRHGGAIDAASAGPGRGSTFTLRLPLADAPAGRADPPQDARTVDPPAPPRPSRPPVLVVDDNVDAADVLAAVLQLEDVPVTIAHDGAAALEAFDRTRPRLVLLDLGLPDIDGTEVARRIRMRPWAVGVRIVAVTGWGQDRARERTRAAGFDAHIVKPVDPEALLALLPHIAPAADAGR